MSLAWIVLILSGMLEAVWATSLGASQGFRKLWPTVTFFISIVLSLTGLGYAMLELPAGTAYAVWVAIGTVLTVAWALITRRERATVLRVVLLSALIMSVVGLKLVSDA